MHYLSVSTSSVCHGSFHVRRYAMFVDDVEKLTGYDFLYNIPNAIQDKWKECFSKKTGKYATKEPL
ncbi:MAG: hypothetical protein MJZ41_02675 [Bacteroidaceae bacterium]|nr:hypothetical protein [Bacteroidaceae bacterium]